MNRFPFYALICSLSLQVVKITLVLTGCVQGQIILSSTDVFFKIIGRI